MKKSYQKPVARVITEGTVGSYCTKCSKTQCGIMEKSM